VEVSGELRVPVTLPSGKEHPTHIEYETGWAPEPVWTRWRREEFPAPAGKWEDNIGMDIRKIRWEGVD